MKLKDLYRTNAFESGGKGHISPAALSAATVIYIVTVASFGRYQVMRLLPYAAYPLFVASLFGIPAKSLIRKIVSISPFVLLIGIWNPFFDSARTEIFGSNVSMGWISFLALVIKFGLITSATLTMVSAVGYDRLCSCAAAVGVPDVLVVQLFLLHRYIRLLVEEAHNVVRARVFRGGRITLAHAGNVCGPLLIRCLRRGERVSDALACRGFEGRFWHGGQISFRPKDWIFLLFWTLFFIAGRLLDLPSLIGGAVTGWVF